MENRQIDKKRKKVMQVLIDEDIHRKLKVKVSELGISIKAAVEELIDEFLRKHNDN